MKRGNSYILLGLFLACTWILLAQSAPPASQQTQTKSTKALTPRPAPPKSPAAPAPMTNQDVIRLVKAQIAEDLIISKISQSKTKFDTSVDALVALKQAGVSDNLISVMMNPPTTASSAASAPAPKGAVSSPPTAPAGLYGRQ